MSPPWMQFYPGDYLRDTADLSTVEHGAYLLLIMHYWTSGGIPNEDDRLARIVRLTSSEWVAIARRVLGFFSSVDGEWKHDRIEDELVKANAKREKLVESGSAGGKAKAKAMANAIANATANALATPEPEPEDKKKEPRDASAREFALEAAAEFNYFWAEYPNKVGKPTAAKAYLSALRRGHKPLAILQGLSRYVAGKPPDRAWLNPATFLNQQRWDDQPAGSVDAPIVRQLVNVLEGTEEMEAWDRHWRQTKGVNAPRSKHGGIFVETQWPPGEPHAESPPP